MHCCTSDSAYSVKIAKLSFASLNLTFFLPSAGSDYTAFNHEITFPAGVNVANFTVTIIDDEVLEASENFYIDLTIPEESSELSVTRGSPGIATVTIADNDGECCSNALYTGEHQQNILNVHNFCLCLRTCLITQFCLGQ